MRRKQLPGEIKNISLQRVPNGAHNRFIKTTIELARKNEKIASSLSAEIVAMEEAQVLFRRFFGVSRKNPLTAEIALHDRLRDGYWNGLKVVVRGMLRFPTPEKQVMAKTLWHRIKTSGISARKQLDRQTGDLLTFTDLLLTQYATEIEGLGVLLFVQKLKEENDLVNELLLERGKMEARRVVGGMKKARAEVFTAYHSFVRKVNALVTLNGPEDYSAFVDAMNKMIERYEEEIIKKPKKRKKAEK